MHSQSLLPFSRWSGKSGVSSSQMERRCAFLPSSNGGVCWCRFGSPHALRGPIEEVTIFGVATDRGSFFLVLPRGLSPRNLAARHRPPSRERVGRGSAAPRRGAARELRGLRLHAALTPAETVSPSRKAARGPRRLNRRKLFPQYAHGSAGSQPVLRANAHSCTCAPSPLGET